MNLEDELRLALRREEPPRDFSRMFARRIAPARWKSVLAIAAALIVCMLIPYGMHERRQAQGKAAKERLVLALEVAGGKLHQAKKVLRNSL